MRRRDLLRTGAATLAALAGCVGGDAEAGTPDPGDDEVLVGPNDSLRFVPETLTVAPGTTVTWTFESQNHNVACDPGQLEGTALPDGAEPFASYDGEDTYATAQPGTTFEHAFEVAGTYEYVCVPHVANGMTGTVEVEA